MRIAIVNDVMLAVEAIRLSVQKYGYEIAWVAYDGFEALNRCRHDLPDLILLDLYMPVMDGVECARHIMAECPCPILIVTASVVEHAAKVFEVMGIGALDAVDTPILGLTGCVRAEELYRKIVIIEKLTRTFTIPNVVIPNAKVTDNAVSNLIVIGSSSGGPQALATILGQLPLDFPAAIALVQHIDFRFIKEFAKWLGTRCVLPVRVAEAGDVFSAGEVLVAYTQEDLILDDTRQLKYTKSLPDAFFQPSIDVFFSSIATHWNANGIGVLLTGMGRDGVLGLLQLASKGFFTIAQNEATSAVFGMPKAAIELRAARQVLPLEEISRVIEKKIRV